MKNTNMNEEEIIQSVMPMIYKIVNRHTTNYTSQDDLISISMIAALEAARNYNPSKGVYSTYCYTKIKYAILTYKREHYNKLSGSSRICRIYYQYKRSYDKLHFLLGREPRLDELSKEMQVAEDRIEESIEWFNNEQILSLNYFINDSDDNILEDTIEDKTISNIENWIDCDTIFNELNPREQNLVLRMLNGDTLTQIGIDQNVSISRMCQIKDWMQKKARKHAEEIGYDYEKF